MITKNGFDLFHWELNCFALKMDFIWKSGIMRRTLWFVRFQSNWSVKHSCTYTYIHMCLVCIHSWGNWVVLLCFGSLTPIVQSCEIFYMNLVENIPWTRLLWNSFMNGLLWINKDVWAIDGCRVNFREIIAIWLALTHYFYSRLNF